MISVSDPHDRIHRELLNRLGNPRGLWRTDNGNPPAQTAPPFVYFTDHKNFWESEMLRLIAKHNCTVLMDELKNFVIRGDGVRLRIPYDYLVMASNEDLHVLIINGINVSREHRRRLGY